MSRYTGKTCRLLCMIVLTSSFFLVEIIVGYVTHSLALVGDSYHMLSDLVALFVGFASVRISKWQTQKNTFGWARAEVLGALVNAVFLIALCFTIFVEAIQRLFGDEHIYHPDLMLIVGAVGLAINIVGLILFAGHGHGHSHGSQSDENHIPTTPQNDKQPVPLIRNSSYDSVPNIDSGSTTLGIHVDDSEEPESEADMQLSQKITHASEIKLNSRIRIKSSAQLNMRAVFLHVMGDALGSVIVIVSALVIKFCDGEWKYKLDPAMSMTMVIIILSTTIPLLKESAFILLQTVPTHIQVRKIQDKLITKIEGVLAVHEFHVWQLAGNRIIASAHIRCQNLRDYMRIAEDVKTFFHNEGIHSTTIQPEFVEIDESSADTDCLLECGPDKSCFSDTCCATAKTKLLAINSSEAVRQRNFANGQLVSSVDCESLGKQECIDLSSLN